MTIQEPVFLIGPSGVGKTTIGRQLAKRLRSQLYDLDQLIEERTGVGIAYIFDIEGEEGFRAREHAVLRETSEQANGLAIIATGAGAVLRADNRDIIKQYGKALYLSAPAELLTQRVERNNYHRPLLQVGDVGSKVKAMLTHRIPIYRDLATWEIDTADRSIKTIIDQIVDVLVNYE